MSTCTGSRRSCPLLRQRRRCCPKFVQLLPGRSGGRGDLEESGSSAEEGEAMLQAGPFALHGPLYVAVTDGCDYAADLDSGAADGPASLPSPSSASKSCISICLDSALLLLQVRRRMRFVRACRWFCCKQFKRLPRNSSRYRAVKSRRSLESCVVGVYRDWAGRSCAGTGCDETRGFRVNASPLPSLSFFNGFRRV